MRTTPLALTTVVTLAVGTALVTGPAPATAGQGLQQRLETTLAIDLPVTVSTLEFCHNDTCLPSEPITLAVVKELTVDLTYDLTRSTTLPDIVNKAGKLSFPEGHKHYKCNGHQGVHLLATGTNIGTTSVKGVVKGKDEDGQAVEQTVSQPPDTAKHTVQDVLLCLKPAVTVG